MVYSVVVKWVKSFSTAIDLPVFLLRISGYALLLGFTIAWPVQYGPGYVTWIAELSRAYFIRNPPYTIASSLHIIFPIQIAVCYVNIIYSSTLWPGWGRFYSKTVFLLGSGVCSLTLALMELVVTAKIPTRRSDEWWEFDHTISELYVLCLEWFQPLAYTCVAVSAAALLTQITAVIVLTLRLPKNKRHPRKLQPVVSSWSWGRGKRSGCDSSLQLEETGRLAGVFQAHETARIIASHTKNKEAEGSIKPESTESPICVDIVVKQPDHKQPRIDVVVRYMTDTNFKRRLFWTPASLIFLASVLGTVVEIMLYAATRALRFPCLWDCQVSMIPPCLLLAWAIALVCMYMQRVSLDRKVWGHVRLDILMYLIYLIISAIALSFRGIRLRWLWNGPAYELSKWTGKRFSILSTVQLIWFVLNALLGSSIFIFVAINLSVGLRRNHKYRKRVSHPS